ncbi:MAG TPA: phage holin family protein [Streptosporangiaceae bacterium]|nr:phage holin family protein [Streptosporangiaceae bacterium]
MGQTAGTPRPAGSRAAATEERSAGELVKEMSELVPRLVRDEIKLAQLEMTQKGKQMGIGAGAFAGGGLVALYAVGCLLACAIIAISGVVAAWLAALIVGVALLAVSGIAALVGKSRLSKGTPPVPKEAIGSVQADVEEVKEKAHR